jgi:hypothetical protein
MGLKVEWIRCGSEPFTEAMKAAGKRLRIELGN